MINFFTENKNVDFMQIERLCKKFNTNFEGFKNYFNSRRIIDINNEKRSIIFRYVGLISFGDLILFILPKYSKHISDDAANIKHSKLIIKVFDKYVEVKNKLINEELETLNFEDEKSSYNKISLLKFFVDDFIRYGLYKSQKVDTVKNSKNSINWTKTIQHNNVIISEGRPIYIDLFSNKKNIDEDNIIRIIHKYILTQAVEFFRKLDIFDFNVDFSEYTDLSYYDNGYISKLLDSALNTEFNDRNIRLIKCMKLYIDKEQFNFDKNEINLYGTRRFEYIWQEVNSQIFDNHYKKSIGEIEKPILFKYGFVEENKPQGNLDPDVLNLDVENGILYIIDAKYYDFYFNSLGKIVGGYPSSYDIVKQLAYEDKLKKRKMAKKIINAFVIPTLEKTESVGYVSYNLFDTEGKIHIINMNVEEAYDNFLNNKLIDTNLIIFL